MEFSAVNRSRPSRETPLGPGAKKGGCFRRLTKQMQKVQSVSAHKQQRLLAVGGATSSPWLTDQLVTITDKVYYKGSTTT